MAILKTAITGMYKEQFILIIIIIIINRQINYLKLIYILIWEGFVGKGRTLTLYDLKGEELKISLFPSILAFL